MAAQRRQHLVAAKGARALQRTFTACGELELRRVERFKYMGRVLSYDDFVQRVAEGEVPPQIEGGLAPVALLAWGHPGAGQ